LFYFSSLTMLIFFTILVRMILILSIIIMSICCDIWHPFCWTWKVNNHISYLFFKTGLLPTTNMFWGNYCVLTTQNTKFLITKCWLLFYNKSMIKVKVSQTIVILTLKTSLHKVLKKRSQHHICYLLIKRG